MGAIELKEYIKQQLEFADDRVLRIVASVFDNYGSETVAFDSKNYPINEREYLDLVEKGFEDISNNDVINHEEMKLKIEKLKKNNVF